MAESKSVAGLKSDTHNRLFYSWKHNNLPRKPKPVILPWKVYSSVYEKDRHVCPDVMRRGATLKTSKRHMRLELERQDTP